MQTCFECSVEVRRDLQRIVDLYATLPDYLGHPAAIRLDQRRGSAESALPGGDHLVLLGPGGDAGNRRRAYLAGLDDAWDQDDRDADPVSVAFRLAAWEDTWRHVRREAASPHPATVSTAAAYLHRWHDWAAQHLDVFDEYAHELRRLRQHLERVTRTSDAPQREEASCLSCGGALYRHWRDVPADPSRQAEGGLTDEATCVDCRRVHTPVELWRAVQQRITDHLQRKSA